LDGVIIFPPEAMWKMAINATRATTIVYFRKSPPNAFLIDFMICSPLISALPMLSESAGFQLAEANGILAFKCSAVQTNKLMSC
jgi:hypothetical protein